MSAIPVIAIFDVGKTNKKLFLFNEDYQIIEEQSARFNETLDEDGFPCDNLQFFRQSIVENLQSLAKRTDIDLKAVNFSTYGASFVYVDAAGDPLTPLYNYLKPFPAAIADQLYSRFGGAEAFALQTASPSLGSLNSGLQLLRLKRESPETFAKIQFALHLPQYVSFLVTGNAFTDCTSIGCHTALWDFVKNNYHSWVAEEGLLEKLPKMATADQSTTVSIEGKQIEVGAGLHDSSAALIPYLKAIGEPFLLLSTGTWGISLNPFNQSPLTANELQHDCLFYLSYEGIPVKAARYFAGKELEKRVTAIVDKYNIHAAALHQMDYSDHWKAAGIAGHIRDYHHMMNELVNRQVQSMEQVLDKGVVKQIYVDGGFSRNEVFLNLLSKALPGLKIMAANIPQATSLGAALVLHHKWNSKAIHPGTLIDCRQY